MFLQVTFSSFEDRLGSVFIQQIRDYKCTSSVITCNSGSMKGSPVATIALRMDLSRCYSRSHLNAFFRTSHNLKSTDRMHE